METETINSLSENKWIEGAEGKGTKPILKSANPDAISGLRYAPLQK